MILTCLQSHKHARDCNKNPTITPTFPSFRTLTHANITILHILYHTYTHTLLHIHIHSPRKRDERSDGAMCGIAVFIGLFNAFQRRRSWYSSTTQETKPTHQEYLLLLLTPPRPSFLFSDFFCPFWFSKEEKKAMKMACFKKKTQK